MYWNRSILTDKTIPFNGPDITLMNKKTRNTFLIDIAVPNTHNLAKTITDKQNKYEELVNEVRAMWKQKAAQVIPIVISSTGVIPKSLSRSLTTLNLHLNTYMYIYIYKKKAVPLQAWTGPEGSKKLRLPDLVTTAQDGGKVVSLTHRPPLPPGNTPGTHFH